MLQYREWPPHPALRPFVRAYWALHGRGAESHPQPVLPDGSSELIVHRRNPFRRHTARDVSEVAVQPPSLSEVAVQPTSLSEVAVQSERLFVGQMRAPVVLQADGDADVVGIRFRPHGAFALLECPQHRFADEIPEVEALSLRWLGEATRRAQEADTAEAALARLEEALLGRLRVRTRRIDPRVAAVVDMIERTAGDVRIEGAAEQAGTSRRHLERLFVEQVGIGPKVLARLARFQAAAVRVVDEPAAPLAAVSGDGGYFDQSHMIRDFMTFAGSSPDELRRRLGQMTAWMLVARPR
jgi:methylphosphotriester-DNA--protein-cysteine methyltransferase